MSTPEELPGMDSIGWHELEAKGLMSAAVEASKQGDDDEAQILWAEAAEAKDKAIVDTFKDLHEDI